MAFYRLTFAKVLSYGPFVRKSSLVLSIIQNTIEVSFVGIRIWDLTGLSKESNGDKLMRENMLKNGILFAVILALQHCVDAKCKCLYHIGVCQILIMDKCTNLARI